MRLYMLLQVVVLFNSIQFNFIWISLNHHYSLKGHNRPNIYDTPLSTHTQKPTHTHWHLHLHSFPGKHTDIHTPLLHLHGNGIIHYIQAHKEIHTQTNKQAEKPHRLSLLLILYFWIVGNTSCSSILLSERLWWIAPGRNLPVCTFHPDFNPSLSETFHVPAALHLEVPWKDEGRTKKRLQWFERSLQTQWISVFPPPKEKHLLGFTSTFCLVSNNPIKRFFGLFFYPSYKLFSFIFENTVDVWRWFGGCLLDRGVEEERCAVIFIGSCCAIMISAHSPASRPPCRWSSS